MTNPSPSLRAALEAWEEHGRAGDSPEECMRAALEAALTALVTEDPLGAAEVARGWRSGVLISPVTVDRHGYFGVMDTSRMMGLSWWLDLGANFIETTPRGTPDA